MIMWANQHKLFQHIHRTNHVFLLLNGLLLMWVTIVPFPTALLAEYITHGSARLAAAVYSGCYVLIALSFNAVGRVCF